MDSESLEYSVTDSHPDFIFGDFTKNTLFLGKQSL